MFASQITLSKDHEFQNDPAQKIIEALAPSSPQIEALTNKLSSFDNIKRHIDDIALEGINDPLAGNTQRLELQVAYETIRSSKLELGKKTVLLATLLTKLLPNQQLCFRVSDEGADPEIHGYFFQKSATKYSACYSANHPDKGKEFFIPRRNDYPIKITDQDQLENLDGIRRRYKEAYLADLLAGSDNTDIKYTICWNEASLDPETTPTIDGIIVHSGDTQHFIKYNKDNGRFQLDSSTFYYPNRTSSNETPVSFDTLQSMLSSIQIPIDDQASNDLDALMSKHHTAWKKTAEKDTIWFNNSTLINLKLYMAAYKLAIKTQTSGDDNAKHTSAIQSNLSKIAQRLSDILAPSPDDTAEKWLRAAYDFYPTFLQGTAHRNDLHKALSNTIAMELTRALPTFMQLIDQQKPLNNNPNQLLRMTQQFSSLMQMAETLKLDDQNTKAALDKATKEAYNAFADRLIEEFQSFNFNNADHFNAWANYLARLNQQITAITAITDSNNLSDKKREALNNAFKATKDKFYDRILHRNGDAGTAIPYNALIGSTDDLESLGMKITFTYSGGASSGITTLEYDDKLIILRENNTISHARKITKKEADGSTTSLLLIINPERGDAILDQTLNRIEDDFIEDNDGNIWTIYPQNDRRSCAYYFNANDPNTVYQIRNDGSERELVPTDNDDAQLIEAIKPIKVQAVGYDNVDELLQDCFGDDLSQLDYHIVHAEDGGQNKLIIAAKSPNNGQQILIEHTAEHKFRVVPQGETSSITTQFLVDSNDPTANATRSTTTLSYKNNNGTIEQTIHTEGDDPRTYTDIYGLSHGDFQQYLTHWGHLYQFEADTTNFDSMSYEDLKDICAKTTDLQHFISENLADNIDLLNMADRTHALIAKLSKAIIEAKHLTFDKKAELINQHLPSNHDVELIAYAEADGKSGYIIEAHYDDPDPRTSDNYFDRGDYDADNNKIHHHQGKASGDTQPTIVSPITIKGPKVWEGIDGKTHIFDATEHNGTTAHELYIYDASAEDEHRWKKASFEELQDKDDRVDGVAPLSDTRPTDSEVGQNVDAILDDLKDSLGIYGIGKLLSMQQRDQYHIYETQGTNGLPQHLVIEEQSTGKFWAFKRDADSTRFKKVADGSARKEGEKYVIDGTDVVKAECQLKANYKKLLLKRGGNTDDLSPKRTEELGQNFDEVIAPSRLHEKLGHYGELASNEAIGFNLAENDAMQNTVLKEGKAKIEILEKNLKQLKAERQKVEEKLALLDLPEVNRKFIDNLNTQLKTLNQLVFKYENYLDACNKNIASIKQSLAKGSRKTVYKNDYLGAANLQEKSSQDLGKGLQETVHQQPDPAEVGNTGVEVTTKLSKDKDGRSQLVSSTLTWGARAEATTKVWGGGMFGGKPLPSHQKVNDKHKKAAIAYAKNLAVNSSCVILTAEDTKSTSYKLSALTLLAYPPGAHSVSGMELYDTKVDLNYLRTLVRLPASSKGKHKGPEELTDLINHDTAVRDALKQFLAEVDLNKQSGQQDAYYRATGIDPKGKQIYLGDLMEQIREKNIPLGRLESKNQQIHGTSLNSGPIVRPPQ